MEIIINETGEREELTIIDRKTGQDMAADIIGNSGAVGDYITIEDGVYSMSAENYQWWSDYLDMLSRYNERLDDLREQYGPAVDDIISRPELWLGEDYNQHEQELQAQINAVLDELAQ